MALSGKLAAVYAQTDDAAIAITKEATTEDATGLRYQITNAAKRYLDPATAVLVYVNNVLVTTGYTIEYAGGVVVFETDPANTVTVSGAYLQLEQVGGFFNWSLDISAEPLPTNAFGDSWESCIMGIFGFSGSAEMYWGDERFFSLLGQRQLLVLYTDTTVGNEDRYECYAYISGDGVTVYMSDVVKETIKFKGDNGVYYRAA
jgi:hypothetical protein